MKDSIKTILYKPYSGRNQADGHFSSGKNARFRAFAHMSQYNAAMHKILYKNMLRACIQRFIKNYILF
ncbi:MAG: hypothetical protein ABF714_11490, partial [Novacetimonas hansenii]